MRRCRTPRPFSFPPTPPLQAVRQPSWAPTHYSPVELENASLLGPFFRVSLLGDDQVAFCSSNPPHSLFFGI